MNDAPQTPSPFRPADQAPDIPGLQAALKAARARNALAWTAEADPMEAQAALSRDVDEILRQLWAAAGFGGAALVAVGGYGRGELFPYSDVDLLILMPEGYREADIAPQAARLVSALWDIGLEAGHSIRSVSDCMAQAQEDLTVATALLERRWLAGPKALFETLGEAWFKAISIKDFAQGKLLEMQQRHGRYQDTPYSLEPNCKESPGGLRDLQVLRWVTTAYGLGKTWQDLSRKGLITEREARQIAKNQRMLALIRGHLHLAAGRREDRLVFDLQHAVAARMDCEATEAHRASEVLMQRYYRAAKSVLQISSMLLANFEPLLFPSASLSAHETAPRVIDEDFQEIYGLLDLRSDDVFQHRPGALLEAFLMLQSRPELRGMTAKTMRAIWNNRHLVNATYRKQPAHKALLLDIFRQPRGIVHNLRLMNNLGILGGMLPVFRRIVGQMQHDLFHVYTVDQHILQVIRNVRRFTMDEHAHEFPLCSRLMNDFKWPWILYIAALFHDIAKGRGGDHSALGKIEVQRFAKDYGLDDETSSLLQFLVEHHLTMSQIAQKQDLADPIVIENFAALVASPRRLTALYLLTVADIRGTSPKVWNNWKGRLLEELFHRSLALLTSDRTHSSSQDWPSDAFHLKTQEAERLLRLHGKDTTAAKTFWKTLELQYFLRHEADEIAWHARALVYRQNPLAPMVIAKSRSSEEFQVMVFYTDEPDLFARICAYFDAQNMSILDAKIHTTTTGHAMDTFLVDQKQFAGHEREMISIVEAGLAEALATRAPLPKPSTGRVSRQSRHFPIPPTVDLQLDSKGQYHVLNITAADRTGLLYTIAHTLARHQVSLQTARVMTLGERAEDVFLVQGAALEQSKAQIALETDLLRAIEI